LKDLRKCPESSAVAEEMSSWSRRAENGRTPHPTTTLELLRYDPPAMSVSPCMKWMIFGSPSFKGCGPRNPAASRHFIVEGMASCKVFHFFSLPAYIGDGIPALYW
jgi:hypothetical protein